MFLYGPKLLASSTPPQSMAARFNAAIKALEIGGSVVAGDDMVTLETRSGVYGDNDVESLNLDTMFTPKKMMMVMIEDVGGAIEIWWLWDGGD
ncbi:hypothetical protein QVD17_41884 [Tagetes erecta]|uniref:Uncharacterized protein n=1 Tax=Tagetes erecta TaxID=13708 RepID=A0AAD8NDY9_TARER|nr:hypothetical protein QVD17_41884 [Tagetes erecta]